MSRRKAVVILDFGSQYTQLIARRIRELSVYCEILPCTAPLSALVEKEPAAIVLSGGPSSVYDEGAPTMDPKVLELGVPVLGICYGMQLVAHVGGGRVERADHREYGPAKVKVERAEGIFSRLTTGAELDVWMSHGDRIEALPPGFERVAESANSPFCAAQNRDKRIFGLQFHPEVAHTKQGRQILEAFLFDVAKLAPDWTAASFVEESIAAVRAHMASTPPWPRSSARARSAIGSHASSSTTASSARTRRSTSSRCSRGAST